MKSVLIGALLAAPLFSFSQKDASVLIIPCITGELIIDGISKGAIEADDAHREQLSYGEHYIQLKAGGEKINKVIKVDQSLSSNIIKLGCEAKNTNSVRLIDKQLSLSGLLSADTEDNYFGLDQGDELNIQCSVLNKKGMASLAVVQYDTGSEIFRKESFSSLQNETVKIPKKGIYKVLLYTDALFGKDAKLLVDRIPAKTSSPEFKTTVRVVADTTFTEVLNTTTRVYSMANLDHPNKTVVKINLPQNTAYWVYWIGVGQASKEKMKQFVSSLSDGAKAISVNPVTLMGLGLVKNLPMLNATSTISYRFADTQNARLFADGQTYSYYKLKYADHISTDYSIVNAAIGDIALCLNNDSSLNGEDVDIKVVAFVITRRLEMDQ